MIRNVGTNPSSATFRGENLIGETIDKVSMRAGKGKGAIVIMDITDITIIDTINPYLEAFPNASYEHNQEYFKRKEELSPINQDKLNKLFEDMKKEGAKQ